MAQLTGRDRSESGSAVIVEERPDGSVVVEADTPEEAVALARERLGGQLQVREAVRLERGGLKGFFAREVYRVDAEPGGGAALEVRPEVEALVRRIDAVAQSSATEAGHDEGVGKALGQVDATEEEFGELLRRELDARGLRSWSGPPRREEAVAAAPLRAVPASGTPGPAPTPPPDTIDLRERSQVSATDPPSPPAAGGDPSAGSTRESPLEPRPPAPVPVGPAAGGRTPGATLVAGRQDAGQAASPVPTTAVPRTAPAPTGATPQAAPAPTAVTPQAAPAPTGATPQAAPAPTAVTPQAAPAPTAVTPQAAPVPTTVTPQAAPPDGLGVRWSIDRLAHLGLPFAVVQRTVGLRPDDDLAWVSALAEAFIPFVSADVDRPAVFAGPRADRIANGLGVPCVVPPDLPPYAGSVGLRTQDDGAGRAWLGRVRGDRSLHVVVGGRGWELFLTKEPDALALAGTDRVVTALQAAVEHGVPVSFIADGGVTREATPLDLAIAVRSMVARS